ncbi:MAG: hypothetical protein IJS45_07150 [Clostridia bacterium]|nr:hypothetical protein [Clostridia bacterium]
MSAFLGPIHFWLYNKIGNQEKLTKEIAEYAASEGWIDNDKAFTKDLHPLETVIDEGNIHGWLQERINDAESRYASLVSHILKDNADRINTLCSIAFEFGRANAVNAESAKDAYKAFEDFFVNGMPCDRVNALMKESDDEVSFEMTQDIHAQYWNGEGTMYYTIRKSVMDGMLNGSEWKVDMPDVAHCCITRKR